MSEEIRRAVLPCACRVQPTRLDAFLALCDPDVEFASGLLELEGGGPYRGHDGVRSWWQNLLSVFPDFGTDIDEVRNFGDLTVARLPFTARV